MLITYSFTRVKYIVSVIFMTPFIFILFSIIYANNSTTTIASERIIDTLIGSFIAIIFSYLILPHWESIEFKAFLPQILRANLRYLEHIILRQSLFPASALEYKLARKDVYVHTANLAAAFQRMMNEPKNKQHQIKEVHKFVVLNHILSSYLANLSASFQEKPCTINIEQLKLIRKTRFYLDEAIQKFDAENQQGMKLDIHLSDSKVDPQITEQLEMITKISADLSKITDKL